MLLLFFLAASNEPSKASLLGTIDWTRFKVIETDPKLNFFELLPIVGSTEAKWYQLFPIRLKCVNTNAPFFRLLPFALQVLLFILC